jgi:hypothetical protein
MNFPLAMVEAIMTKANNKSDQLGAKSANAAKSAMASKPKLAVGFPEPSHVGAPTAYKPEFVRIARAMAKLGATDFEIAEELGVTVRTVWRWRSKHEEFCQALLEGKDAFDDRIERSLAQKAAGYTFHTEKVMQFEGKVIRADIVEHIPPDVGAIKLWLSNRRPDKWREKTEAALTSTEAFVSLWHAISSGTIGAAA